MLKQLRWKFILINMILVTLVLTIVFAAVLAFSYRRLEMESTQAMERVLRSGNTDFPKREIGGGKPPNEKEPPKTMTAAFYVELNADGAVKNVFGENVTVTNEPRWMQSLPMCWHRKGPPAPSVEKAYAFSSRVTALPLPTGPMKSRA